MTPRQIVASYLLIQAIGTAAWWAWLLYDPESTKWFQPAAWPVEALLGFWLGDFLLLVGGSVATAVAVLRALPWAAVAIWSLTAAVWYPTLYCIGVSVMTDQAWIASAMMVTMAGLTLAMATIYGTVSQSPSTIRVISLTRTAALGWTVAQVVIFWGIFLWIIPAAIVEFEQRLYWSHFSHSGQTVMSLVVFTAASVLGLWSGITMATVGDGTPLPTATAPKLVVSGPYRYVRNPMALAGVLQGIAVGWLLGSRCVVGYAIAGAVAWHLFIRPIEEADLKKRLGDDYRKYQNRVRVWLPTFSTKRESNQNRHESLRIDDDEPGIG
ncbi:MAG: isoprenylcysteine carboxylmethyltransferase family protein [Phycisphaera sp. RhM]|nr:isoprenylcysteine carboxylmethyltransferase family protein [Phycisphaera sp. RhM]